MNSQSNQIIQDIPGGTSIWVRVDAGETNLGHWAWVPRDMAQLSDIDLLISLQRDGWEQLNLTNNDRAILLLHGQMASLISIGIPDQELPQVWVRKHDKERVQAIPVALGFSLNKVGSEEQQSSLAIPILEQIPPPWFGNIAFIELPNNKGYWWYHIEALGKEAQELQAQLAEALQNLGADGWHVFTPRMPLMMQPGGYERRLAALQKRARTTLETKRHQEIEAEIALLKQDKRNFDAWEQRVIHRLKEQEAWQVRLDELQPMVQTLTELYWKHYQADRPLSHQTPATADAFAGGRAQITSSLPVQAVLNAFSGATEGRAGWAMVDGLPTYTHSKETGITHIQVRGQEEEVFISDTLSQSLWESVKAFSDLDGDVFLCLLAQSLIGDPDANGTRWITADRILDYRGIRPIIRKEHGVEQRHGHRTEDQITIAQSIARQQTIWLTVRQALVDDKGRKGGRIYTHNSRLVVVDEDIRQQNLFPDSAHPHAIAWRYRIGTWIEPYLDDPNKQLARISRKTLEYDPYHERWEKRLARYFIFHLRMNVRQDAITRSIEGLLKDLHLPINKSDPQKTRDRFEKAMDRLKKDGQIDEWQYKLAGKSGIIIPPDKADSVLPSRKWLKVWQGWDILVKGSPLLTYDNERARQTIEREEERRKALRAARKAPKP